MRYLLALTIAASLLVASPSPVSADTPGCVSLRELKKVGDTNYTKRRVHQIFDTRGNFYERGGGFITRHYRGCGGAVADAWVNYERRNGAWRWAGHAYMGT